LINSSIPLSAKAAGALTRWEPSDDEEVHRCCYLAEAVFAFLRSEKAQLFDWGKLKPAQQIASKLDAFVSGDHLASLGMRDNLPVFRKLQPKRPEGPNIWELRTWDVRLFGWFPGPRNTFVGVVAALKKDLLLGDGSENPNAYRERIDEVAAWRTEYDLDQHIWKLTEDDLPLHLKR
jgi:hypothetical protein